MVTLDTTAALDDLIERALAEDLGDAGDVTAQATVPEDLQGRATVRQKAPGVISGLDAFQRVLRAVDPSVSYEPLVEEGVWREDGPVLAAEGSARSILAAERTALNIVGRLSGVATMTRRYADAVQGTRAVILDTRKTTPGMRLLEKRAVLTGGGANHRIGLFDEILIKENHAAMAGGVGEAVRAAHALRPDLPLVVECQDLREVKVALHTAGDLGLERFRILLDNMDHADMRKAVAMSDGRVPLEASGNVSLATVGAIAATGVDFISSGALTHSAPVLDLSLILEPRT
ncbi:carboxylating nicotinate-nucleotide diphosphorylase [Patulibacter sp.]|uniref:carboxylating nicotinate-nucleotide diphosphorylase n=1 Tax=Patulibacter sp. TaxID=1912859 RepID=UPI00271BEC8E|nr:carboxylating nicotinate-nucleotide diphosphorylase [Patulibacter sp.]MDO9410759.1 carboxylating nicotinate-nucleotide diphosphorylase [Patulibacter sp.]